MKKVIVQTKQQAKATGKPIGAIIDYDDAPEWMQRQHGSIHEPLSPEMERKLQEQHDADIAWAENVRKRLAEGHMPF